MKTKLILVIVFFLSYTAKAQKKNKTVFGIDISEYQGDISWEKVVSQKDHPVKFVIIRATMGGDRKDSKFQDNFKKARKAGFIVGAYHYYDPNENSTIQAENYLESIKLEKGDFVPILDIERLSKIQSNEKLKKGITNWLNIVEKKYGTKPIIYTGFSFYGKYLKKDFADYPIWIAAYSNKKRKTKTVSKAAIHQFSEKVTVSGIDGRVDGNDIKQKGLKILLIK